MPMPAPEAAQVLQHRRGDRDETVFAAFALAHEDPPLLLAQVADFQPAGFADAQPGVIDQPQDGAKPVAAHAAQQPGHFLARQHRRQRLVPADFELLPELPAGAGLQVIAVECAQGGQGDGDRAAGIVALVAQEEEEVADLLFAEQGGIGVVAAPEEGAVAEVGFAGPGTQIAELDILPELRYGIELW